MKRIFFMGLAALLFSISLSGPEFLMESAKAADQNDAAEGKKVYPGVYTEEEKKELDEFLKNLKPVLFGARPPSPGDENKEQGPQTSADAPMPMKADLFTMKLYANAFDYWNPLYNDEEYAKKTRYGGLICVPFYKEAGAMFPTLNLKSFGRWGGRNDGGDMEFFKPIYAGDSFTLKANQPTVRDITPAEGSNMRIFAMSGSGDLINQNGEVVIRGTMYGRNLFTKGDTSSGFGGPGGPPPGGGPGGPPPGGPPPGGPPPGGGPGGPPPGGPLPGGGKGGPPMMGSEIHTYTDEDYEKIHEIENSEVVRGADILFWEDVAVGDEPPLVITGPLTVLDSIQCFGLQIMQGPPMRERLKNKDKLVGLSRDKYGIYHLMEELHFGNMNNCDLVPITYMVHGRSLMVRGITNYMGDDGWLRKFSWRNESLADDLLHEVPYMKDKSVTGHSKITDVLIAKYYVTKKYIDKKEHLVDIVTWVENFDGIICQAGKATVILESKKGGKK